jgi:hypothetical protein
MVKNEKFVAEINRVWKSPKMRDYCIKKAFDVVELESGHIFVIEKPSIETRFCFGCGQFGNATDDEMANASERRRDIHKFENFKKANIESAFGRILKEIKDGYGYFVEYDGGKDLVGIIRKNDGNFDWFNDNNKIVALMTETDRVNLMEAVNKAIKRFENRLETYWKKYQDTKLTTWTYIVD